MGPGFHQRLGHRLIAGEQAALKSDKSLGDRTSDQTKSDEAHRRAGQARAVQFGAPAVKSILLDAVIASHNISAQREHQADRQFCGRHRQQIRDDRQPDSRICRGLNVDIVETFQCRTDDAKPGTGSQESGVNPIGHERKQSIRIPASLPHFFIRPGLNRCVGHDSRMLFEQSLCLCEDRIGHNNFGSFGHNEALFDYFR